MKKLLTIIAGFLLIPSASLLAQSSNISGIINTYAKITAIDSSVCPVSLTLSSSAGYNVGDTVLIVQMKGAAVDTTNTSSFGSIVDYKNAGNYEFCIITSINGNTVGLKYKLMRSYDPAGYLQLVRVPSFFDVIVIATLTAPPWNSGTGTGGILVFQAAGTVTLNANIDVSGKGFTGASVYQDTHPCTADRGYFYPSSEDGNSFKGEGIYDTPLTQRKGKGAVANGGGGNMGNMGAAGGGNFGAGGIGGIHTGCSTGLDNALGGYALTYNNVNNKIFLGGSGGAGEEDQTQGTNGANGGGIVIIKANVLTGNNNAISSNGNSAAAAGSDAAGGGGGGGDVILSVNSYSGNTFINTKGGKGGDNTWGSQTGTGGGGGGGVVWVSQAALPANITYDGTGGANGTWIAGGTSGGAAPGQAGGILTGLNLSQSTTSSPTRGNANAGPDQVGCQGNPFTLNASGGITYTWSPSTYLSSTAGASVIASPTAFGAYNYTVAATNANGCISYAGVTVTVAAALTANAGIDGTICSGMAWAMNGSGGQTYTWSPSTGLSSATGNSVTFNLSTPGVYNYTLTAASGSCNSTDAIAITVNPNPIPTLSGLANATVCFGNSVPLSVSGATNYTWSPAKGLSSVTGQTVIATPSASTVYTVIGTNSISNCTRTSNISVAVSINPLPTISISPAAISICAGSPASLSATGSSAAQPINYLWLPASGLSSSVSQTVSANPSTTTAYTITGTDANGCYNTTTVKVGVNALPVITGSADETICSGRSVTLSANGGNTYTWSPATNPATNQVVTASPLNTTTYTVTGKDLNGCSNTALIKITPSPVVVTSQNATITLGESTTISVNSNGTSFVWSPSASLSCNSCSITTASPAQTTLYKITVTDNNGCSRLDTIIVTVESKCGSEVFIPNAFSPNEDGQNDILYARISDSGCIQKLTFEIYDRWGNKVFESSDPAKGWDGKLKEKEYSTDVFVYSLQATLKDKTIISKKGNISRV